MTYDQYTKLRIKHLKEAIMIREAQGYSDEVMQHLQLLLAKAEKSDLEREEREAQS